MKVGQLVVHWLRGDQGAAQQGDVLVVPSVAVRERGAVRDAADLVPVVPPVRVAYALSGRGRSNGRSV